MKKLFIILFVVTIAEQSWATTILRQDDNLTTDCAFYDTYFQFDFNTGAGGAQFKITYEGEIFETTNYNPTACVIRNFVKNGSNIEFDLLDSEYSTTEFAHYITRLPVAVSAYAENGIVSIEGSNAVGQTIVLTVTPNDDYVFNCWSDGNTNNPRTIVIDGNMDLKAICLSEGQTLVTLTVTAGENGTVSGGGICGSGTVAKLYATPNTGYHFVSWNDSNTDNPRTVTVSSDATFTAEFEEHTVVIEEAVPPTTLPGYGYTEGSHCSVCGKVLMQRNYTYWYQLSASAENGNVSGAGIYAEGQNVTLTVTPNENYEFNCWSDGNTDNPRTISIGWEHNSLDFKALCMTKEQTIASLFAGNVGNGTVSGAGCLIKGLKTTFKLQANANEGNMFVRWSDGNTDNPRIVTVTDDTIFMAVFKGYESGIYRFEANGDFEGDKYIESNNGVFTIHTHEADEYQWNSQFFVVFADENNTISSGNTISLKFDYKKEDGAALRSIQVHSIPHQNCNFVYYSMPETTDEWQTHEVSFDIPSNSYDVRTIAIDASTGENGTFFLRNIVVKVNGNLFFKTKETSADTEAHSITTASNNGLYGTAEVIGSPLYGCEVTIKASPAAHYHFISWNDGNTDNPRTVAVTGNATYTANFAIDSYNVAATADATAGNAYCSHSKVDYGTPVTFYAIPKYGYFFKNWNNSSTTAIQNITISQDTTLTAIFEKYPSVIVKDTIIHDTIKVEVPVTVTNTVVEYIKDTIVETVKDTIVETVKDTIIETIKDTIIQTVKDTIVQTVKDTITVTDTIRITNTDTIKIQTIIYDTITNTVHDTIYITKTDTVYLQTSVSEKNAIGLKVYPNPTVSFVTVDADAEFSFVLTDLNGKLLRKEENAASYLLDLSEYPDGVYLLNTSDGTTHKIVKE